MNGSGGQQQNGMLVPAGTSIIINAGGTGANGQNGQNGAGVGYGSGGAGGGGLSEQERVMWQQQLQDFGARNRALEEGAAKLNGHVSATH